MSQVLDYYRILQVGYAAQKAEITAAYRRLCKLYHPDVNPGAEEIMKQINLAYATLSDDTSRQAYNLSRAGQPASVGAARQNEERLRREAEDRQAFDVMNRYFAALRDGDYDGAYRLLSNYDRRYVTLQSFLEWRRSVQKLYVIREYKIRSDIGQSGTVLRDGTTVPGKKHYVSITEKNVISQTSETYQAIKLAIREADGWRVFLGYRDLNEIARIFEDLSVEHERGEMARHWREYCVDTCRELDMLSLKGLVKEASRELYRYKRYRQPLCVACFRVMPAAGSAARENEADMIEAASKALIASLRETDIPAYTGDGVFAVLFVELKRRQSETIVQRVASRLRTAVGSEMKMRVRVDSSFSAYDGGSLEAYIERLSKK